MRKKKANVVVVVIRYALFPYAVCYDVEELLPGGRVKVQHMGTFEPSAVLAVLEGEDGRMIRAALWGVEQEYAAECRATKRKLLSSLARAFTSLAGLEGI